MLAEPKWILQEPEAAGLERIAAVEACRSLSPLVRRLLCLRGFREPEAIERFLFPRLRDLADPFLLPEMDKAVRRILAAADAGERVVLYGDYDVDGVTSLTVFKRVLEAYGIDAATFLPHRTEEGYGVSADGLKRCLSEHSPQLLIAIDCGTSSALEVAALGRSGIDVIILDHHECPPGARPECVALVNPKCPPDGGRTGFEYLCSAGIAFKVGHALLKTRHVEGFDLRDCLDITALGTIADIVPLIDENRLIVRKGLVQLERTGHPGLRALKRVASLTGRIAASDVGFRIGPRLNASGRVDTAQASLDLLLTGCDIEAGNLASQLDVQNRERQGLERQSLREAEEMLAKHHDPHTDPCIVLGSENWHPGVVGIVASRLMRAFHRPTFVVAFGEEGVGKGSGRSVPGISLVEAINRCRGCLINGGGHDMAAGITLERSQLEGFREAFGRCIREFIAGGDALVPRLTIDVVATFDELDLAMLDSYELLQPFGSANPEPLFMARGVAPAGEPRVLNDRHLKFRLVQGRHTREAIFFNSAQLGLPKPPWDVAFHVSRNVFRGRENLQLTVQGIRGARAPTG